MNETVSKWELMVVILYTLRVSYGVFYCEDFGESWLCDNGSKLNIAASIEMQ